MIHIHDCYLGDTKAKAHLGISTMSYTKTDKVASVWVGYGTLGMESYIGYALRSSSTCYTKTICEPHCCAAFAFMLDKEMVE